MKKRGAQEETDVGSEGWSERGVESFEEDLGGKNKLAEEMKGRNK